VALAHAAADSTLLPLLADKPAGATGARAYVCEDFRCLAPVDTVSELAALLAASGT
jgi:uncharacterized protein YyaL (SSP411 family)